jgi:TadE-like protein
MKVWRLQRQEGLATLEFAMMATVLLALAWAVIEFGSLLQAQAVVTNVTREGGSLASRDLKTGPELFLLLERSSSPLDFEHHPNQFKMFLARVQAGISPESPVPTCTVYEHGDLSSPNVISPTTHPHCGLTPALYEWLQFKEQTQASALPQLTVVTVFYAHRPLTPLDGMLSLKKDIGLLNVDLDRDSVDDSILIQSQAIF